MRDLAQYYDNAVSDVGTPVKILVWLGKLLVGNGIRIIFRARYLNMEVFDRLPEGKPVIVAGNHSSYTDPMFIFDALWPKRIRFMAKAKLFTYRIFDRILAMLGVFPVHYDARGRTAIKRSVKCLKRGELVGIFPEGTRVKTHDKTGVPYSDGIALIAKMADALIVPVGIEGAIDISPDGSKRLRFPRVTLRFGEPVYWKDFAGTYAKSELMSAVTDEVMRRVRALTDGIDPGPTPPEVLDPIGAADPDAAPSEDADVSALTSEMGESGFGPGPEEGAGKGVEGS